MTAFALPPGLDKPRIGVAVSRSLGTAAAVTVDGINWTATTIPSGSYDYVAYGNGRFVAVGNGGYGAYSEDGVNWTSMTPPSANNGLIVFGNGIFLAVDASANTYTSSDGITWATHTSALPNSSWSSLYFAGGLFFASNSNSSTTTVYTSPDGITWTSRTMPSAAYWIGFAFSAGTYVAVSEGTASATSSNGTTWSAGGTLPASGSSMLCYGNGLFVASSQSGTATAYSTNGSSWTAGGALSTGSTQYAVMTESGGLFVAFGSFNTATASACSTSPDGVTWTQRTLPSSSDWGACAFNTVT